MGQILQIYSKKNHYVYWFKFDWWLLPSGSLTINHHWQHQFSASLVDFDIISKCKRLRFRDVTEFQSMPGSMVFQSRDIYIYVCFIYIYIYRITSTYSRQMQFSVNQVFFHHVFASVPYIFFFVIIRYSINFYIWIYSDMERCQLDAWFIWLTTCCETAVLFYLEIFILQDIHEFTICWICSRRP